MDAKLQRKTKIDLNRINILANALKRNRISFINQESFIDEPESADSLFNLKSPTE